MIAALMVLLMWAAPAHATPMKLIVEAPDGSFSETLYPSEKACERARRAMQREAAKREVRARAQPVRKGAQTRWVIGPSCFPL